MDQQAEKIKRLQVALARVEEEKAFMVAEFEYKKDVFTNFVYYNAFADVIRAHSQFDPSRKSLPLSWISYNMCVKTPQT